jgi:hypothetical protein
MVQARAHGVHSMAMPDLQDQEEVDGTTMAANAAAHRIAKAQKISDVPLLQMRRPKIV